MKKFLSVGLIAAFMLGAIAGLAGCGGEEDPAPQPHTHSYATTWSYGKETHWHAATCPDAEGDDLIADEAPHGTPGADGKCPTCGYKIIGTMTLAEYKETEKYGEGLRDFARFNMTGSEAAALEFVWATEDANSHKLATLNYLYSTSGDAFSTRRFYEVDVAFEDIAAGNASYGDGGSVNYSDSTNYFTCDDQTGKQDLADAAFEAYKTHRAADAYEPTYTAPLLRLVTVNAGSTSTRITLLDVFETGYVQYAVFLTADAEKTDAELIQLLQDGTSVTRCTAPNPHINLGELLYSKM